MRRVDANEPQLQYSGRIDFENKMAPEFVFPCSYVRMRFTGTSLQAEVSNYNLYWDNYLGVIIDGIQKKVKLSKDDRRELLVLAEDLEDKEHEVLLFKRQDSCHTFRFYGFLLDEGAKVLSLPAKPVRRIEVYGDSVSAGEVSEAVAYAGKPDPEHQGEFSNSWYSYAWIAARKLHAQLHDIAQGGIALMDDTGWFCEPDAVGMETAYDKIQYHPQLPQQKCWDFKEYRPHVVIVALGQNDNHPDDYMAEDRNGERAERWREHYREFLKRLRQIYPAAHIILTTTVLIHHKNWDDSIELVCRSLGDEKIHHFLYSNNGAGTPGHIRIPEAEQMAEELCAYIESLGEAVWCEEEA